MVDVRLPCVQLSTDLTDVAGVVTVKLHQLVQDAAAY